MMENELPVAEPIRTAKGKGLRLVRKLSRPLRLRLVLRIARYTVQVALGHTPTFLTSTGQEISTFTEWVRHQARLARVSERTAWRWYRRFLESGYTGLIDRPRKDKSVSRAFDGRDAATAFVLVNFLDGHTAVRIHRQLAQLWPRLYGTASRCPCLDTVNELAHMMIPARIAKKVRP